MFTIVLKINFTLAKMMMSSVLRISITDDQCSFGVRETAEFSKIAFVRVVV